MRVALLMIGLAVAAPAWAAPVGDMPIYDPNTSCESLADATGNHTLAVSNNCIDQEQTAYNQLRMQWPLVPIDGKKLCLPQAAKHKPLQYTTLLACLGPYVTREMAKQKHEFHL